MNAVQAGRRVAAACATGLLLTALAGCGGGDKTSGDTATTASQSFKQPPVKIAVNTSLNAQVVGDFSDEMAAVKAAAKAINDKGGIQGHELVVSTCDTKGDPNAELACARKAVDDGVIATVGTVIISNFDGYLKTLQKADIADVGVNIIGTQQATYPNTFPIVFNFGGLAECAGTALAKQSGGNRVALFVTDTPTGNLLANFVAGAAMNADNKYAGTVAIPATATDMSSYVQQMADLDPDFVVGSMSEQQMQAFIAAANQTGKTWKTCSFISGALGNLAGKLGPAADDFYHGTAVPSLGDAADRPGMAQYLKEMQAAKDAGDEDANTDPDHYSATALLGWLSTKLVAEVADTIQGPITAKSFLDAINTYKWDGDDVLPAMDFAKPLGIGRGQFPRVFNDAAYLAKWDAGEKKFVTVPDSQIEAITAIFGEVPPS